MSIKNNRKKGFTMVEMLCAIVILGIVSIAAIRGVGGMIDKANQEKIKQQERTLQMATESYLQANTQYRPKSIGDVTKIKVSDLKKSNYLKEEIKNKNGDSCMDKSYIRVYKLSKKEYTYSTYIYCGDDVVPEEEDVPTPKITVSFTDKDGNTITNPDEIMQNTAGARLNIEIVGSEDESESVKIDGYSYEIYKDDVEVFNSGTLSANRNEKIKVSKELTDYVKVNQENKFSVKVIARNIYGGYKEIHKEIDDTQSSAATYKDTTPPICASIQNQAQEGEWISLKSNVKERTITVHCSDGDGSGCLRESFSKTWPNDNEEASENSKITIKDNAGNSTNCDVKVNVDLIPPIVEIDAFKNKRPISELYLESDKSKGSALKYGKITTDKNNYEIVINSTDYNNLSKEGWLNRTNYPYGIAFEIKMSDNMALDKYSWETNSSAIIDKQSAEFNQLSVNKLEQEKLKNINSSTSNSLIVGFKYSGARKGVLKVYDIAGNVTTITIYADMDVNNIPNSEEITPPEDVCGIQMNKADLKLHKFKSMTNENIGEDYIPNTWSNLPVIAELPIKDCPMPPNVTNIETYKFEVTYDSGKTEVIEQKTNFLYLNDPENPTKFNGKIKVKGAYCTKSGNCTDYTNSKTILIDTVAPKCNVSATNNNKAYNGNWIKKGQKVLVTATCDDKVEGITNVSNCQNTTVNGVTYKTTFTKEYTAETEKLEINNAGAVAAGDGGVIIDGAGNITYCSADKTVKIDPIPPTCNVTSKTNTNATYTGSWLPKGSTVTFTGSCADYESGCDTNYSTFTKEYSGDLDITNGGPNGTVKDIAGNETQCSQDLTVKIDANPPECTNSGDNNKWKNADITIKWGCKDTKGTAKSGCKKTNVGSKKCTITQKTAAIGSYTIEDNAGNKTTCKARTANVYIDKTAPICGAQNPSAEDTFNGGNVSIGCTDEHSGCSSNTFTKSFAANDTEGSIEIKDAVGNKAVCDIMLSTFSSEGFCQKSGQTLFGTSLGSQSHSYENPKEKFEYVHWTREKSVQQFEKYAFTNYTTVQNYLPINGKKYGFLANWNQSNWCYANGGTCGYTRYCYPRVCSNKEECGTYLGWSADAINKELGCGFARCWCSCNNAGDWANL